jgi:hypothetical protein
MSTDMPPKNWKDAIPNTTWGALVFTCFFVFIEKLVEQNYGQALAALILGLAIMAVALHSKTWLERTNPNWIFAAFTLLVAAIVLSPLIEQRRWPFFESNAPQSPVVIHDPPSAEDIAKATATISNQLNIVTQQRDSAVAKAATLSRQLEEARKEASIRPLSDDSIHNARISLDKLTTIMSRFQERRLLFVEGCDQYQKLLNALTYHLHPSNAFFAQKVENASKEKCGRTISRIGGIGEEYGYDKNRLEQTILQK